MKTLQIFTLFFFASCSIDLPDPEILLRSGNYITYNPLKPCLGQEVTVTFDNGYGNNCGISRIQQRVNGAWVTLIEGIPQSGLLTYTFLPQLPGNYRFRASWNKSGKDCQHDNIKAIEEEPLYVEEECCRDYFTATALCDNERPCSYGLEFHFMTTIDNWISITGLLSEGYSFCGLYDGDGLIIEEYSGNAIQVIADVPACTEFKFYVYFSAPVQFPSFGSWKVMDMHGQLYHLEPPPCD